MGISGMRRGETRSPSERQGRSGGCGSRRARNVSLRKTKLPPSGRGPAVAIISHRPNPNATSLHADKVKYGAGSGHRGGMHPTVVRCPTGVCQTKFSIA